MLNKVIWTCSEKELDGLISKAALIIDEEKEEWRSSVDDTTMVDIPECNLQAVKEEV